MVTNIAKARGMTLEEPIEVRMASRSGTYLLWAYVEGGIIIGRLAIAGHGCPESLENLQSTSTFPRKAVRGWQQEVINFCENSIYAVTEVR